MILDPDATGARGGDRIVLNYKNASVPRLMTTDENPAGMMVFTNTLEFSVAQLS